MSGIQIFTSSPLNTNASKSKETTVEPTTTQVGPANTTATITTAHASNSGTAQPGAAIPAPTSAATVYTPDPTQTTALPQSPNPPPPQPGQAPRPFETQSSPQGAPAPAPVQWSPSYAYAQPPKGVTSTAQDLSHPPGYVQNHHASFDDRQVNHDENSSSIGRGILGGQSPFGSSDETSPIWDTAMSWAKEAGRKLSVVEEEVWKRISKDK